MKKMLVTSVLMLMVFSGLTSAAVLRVDFNGYYSYNTPDNAAWTYDGAGLLGTGTFWNGAEVSWETPNTISSVYHPGSGSGNNFLLDDGVTDAQVTITLAGNEYGDRPGGGNALTADYLLGVNSTTITITIGGLIPDSTYKLAGYGKNADDHVGGVWIANGAGPLDLSYNVADSGILENVIADTNGQIVISVAADYGVANGVLTAVNGFELEGTFVPEPLTMGLLGLGGLALLRRRR